MQSVCVFCGSSKGKNPKFVEAAKLLGRYLAELNIKLIYGGGKIGLMGVLADSCMANGGHVIGVIPKFLSGKEIAHEGVTELIAVDSMHQRKLKMSELAEGFIALPGGYGTLEEFMEILTWVQLSLVTKPVGILNVDGFYDHLIHQFKTMAEQQLLKRSNLDFFVQADNVKDLLKQFEDLSIRLVKIRDKFIDT